MTAKSKKVAIRISVEVLDEIRVWEVPEETSIYEVIEMAEQEINYEFQEVGLVHKGTYKVVEDVEAERKTLLV